MGRFKLGATVNAAARCGLWPLALHLLASPELDSNVVCWNAAMTACEVGGSLAGVVLVEENQWKINENQRTSMKNDENQ